MAKRKSTHHKKHKTTTTHGKGRHGTKIPIAAMKDPWKGKAQAHGQGRGSGGHI